ncbi:MULTISPECIES: cupin domain-containing protein [unclassified Bradyrhizobium]|uniref:cupin domain-containing protein n=1 Tax=unclassified Bradyrhizobium TaxID=2631580 RepID=UPI003D2019BB
MAKPIRRIVTGHRADGRSVILSDDAAPSVHVVPGTPGLAGTVLWVADRSPADIVEQTETAPADRKLAIEPPAGGNMLRIAEFPPDSLYSREELEKFRREIGSPQAFDTKARHFFFHKTPTLDYAIVLEGEVWAMMDEGETLMRPGDVLIQRGTNHAWSNRSDKVCRVAFVLIDAEHH